FTKLFWQFLNRTTCKCVNNFSAFSPLRLHTFPLPFLLHFVSRSFTLTSPSHCLSFAFLSFSLCHSFPNPALLHVAFCIFSTLTLPQPQCPSAPATTRTPPQVARAWTEDKLQGGDRRAGNHR
ncbi:hypothetical protein VIGAN_04043500, partial [Vigna angularis var. angularis]